MSARKKRTPPVVGSWFERTYKGKKYRMVVVKNGSGVGYKLGNHVFGSPSGAARSVTASEANGWAFWRIETTEE